MHTLAEIRAHVGRQHPPASLFMPQLSRRAFIATGLGAFATLVASPAVARAIDKKFQ
jgi:hypothetical protein